MDARQRDLPWWAWLAGVFLLALLARAAFIAEIRDVPMVRFPVIDSEAYLQWARQIAGGDWLGSEPFYQAPLYPYFLAATMRLVGDDAIAIRFVQAAVGAVSCVLLAAASRRLFSTPVGVLAGALLAIYPPSIFLGALIQKTVLDELGFATMLWLISRLRQSTGLIVCGALGMTIAALALTRENALLLIPVVAGWLAITISPSHTNRVGARLTRAGTLTLGAVAILSIVAWRNYVVCGQALITTYQSGPNFYIGNNPSANGSYVALSAGRGQTRYERIDAIRIAQAAAGRELSPREVSRFWYAEAFKFIRAEPLPWLRLTAHKLFLATNAYEIPDSEDQAFYADHSVLLGLLSPITHFGLLLPLAVAGAWLSWSKWPETRLIVLMAAIFLLSTAAFFVLARYRYPLAVLLMPLASHAIVEIVRRVRCRETASLWGAIAVGVLVAAPANWPTPFPAQAELATSYANAGITLANIGEADTAEHYLKKSLEIQPGKAAAHFGMGQVWSQRRQPANAIAEYEIALAGQSNVPHVLAAMGTAKLMARDIESAIDYLQRSVEADPFDPAPWSNLAEAHRRRADWPAAVDALRRGANANPSDFELQLRLAWFLAAAPNQQVRDGAAAVKLAESAAASMSVPNAAVLDVLAAAYAEVGRFDEAIRTATSALDRCGGDLRLGARISARLTEYRADRAARLE
ncbi:MAG: glycosyltransferase family 39 protein [Phycisphaerales bacterium]|nr:glycosyltransferase family 39 protein [Phycisphaerales bacterium]